MAWYKALTTAIFKSSALDHVVIVWALSTRQLIAGAPENERSLTVRRSDVVTPVFFLATADASAAR